MTLKKIHEKRTKFFINRTDKDNKSTIRRRSLSQKIL